MVPEEDWALCSQMPWCGGPGLVASQHETSASSDSKPFLLGLMLCQPGLSPKREPAMRRVSQHTLFSQPDWFRQPERKISFP